MFKIEKRKYILCLAYLTMFIFINYLGYMLNKNLGLIYNKIPIIFIIVLMMSSILSIIICKIIDNIHFEFKELKCKINSKNRFFIFFLLGFISYIPALLAYYPSIWSYDITTQIDQIMNSGYTRYHPLLHTFLIDVCIQLGDRLFNSYTFGALIYSLIQMTILSMSIAYAINYIINNFKINRITLLALMVFYLLMPFNAIMAISTTKDTIFAALTIILFVKTFDILYYKKNSIKQYIEYLIIIILWFSFRNNAYFAFLAFAVISVFILWSKKLKIIFLCTIIICTNLIFNACLDKAFDADTISSAEVIAVPGSQIAMAAIRSPDKIIDSQWYDIEIIFGDNYRYYNPYLFDTIKTRINFQASEMKKLLVLWATILPNCLTDYIDSFMLLNSGSWYILDKSHTRVYIDKYFDLELTTGNLVDRHQGYLQTDNAKVLDINFQHYLNGAYDYYEGICSLNRGHNNPITAVFLSPGIYLWIVILCLFVAIYKKDKNLSIPLILLILYWFTTLLGPCTLFRYMYPVIICTPICLCLSFSKRRDVVNEK